MSDFVLNRNHCLRTLHGHIIDFKKGQPTYVPPVCRKEAVAIGATCVDGEFDPLDPELPEVIPLTADERQGAIITAFKMLEERAGREDFTASGFPTKKALVKILEFDVDKKEYEPLFTAYMAEKGAVE